MQSPTKQLRTHRRAFASQSPLGPLGVFNPTRLTDAAGIAGSFRCQPAQQVSRHGVATFAASSREQQPQQEPQWQYKPRRAATFNQKAPRTAPTAHVRPPHPGAIDGLQLRQRLRQGKRPQCCKGPSPMRQVQQLQDRQLPSSPSPTIPAPHCSKVMKEVLPSNEHHVATLPASMSPAQARQLLAPAVADGSYYWVCVHQQQADDAADVYLLPWDQGPMNDNLQPKNGPSLTVSSYRFSSCKMRYGNWHNFLIRVQGDFHELEEMVMWPHRISLMTVNEEHLQMQGYAGVQQQQFSQPSSRLSWAAPQGYSTNRSILRLERWKHNLRHLDDLVVWLADPIKEEVAKHLANLQEQHVDKSPEEHYATLCNCYGRAALQALYITRAAVVDFLLHKTGSLAEAALSQSISRLHIQHYRREYGLARTR